jgi:glycosyltransferase involved in cell wall biosynthesis
VFLPELYPGVPIVNYFEFYYHPHQSDMDFRPEFPPSELDYLRDRSRNAMLLLDLENCRYGYSPTHFQRQLFPEAYRPKIDVIFDGIETDIFRPLEGVPRRIGDRSIPASTRVVTYVSRGFESMRGFDVFMDVAQRISQQFPDVVFVVVGSDRVCYGGDEKHIQHKTFFDHVMARSSHDPAKFIFTGLLPVSNLVEVLSLSDLHLYFTVPFVLSWSLMDALACGCTVLASDTAPVREMIEDGRNGCLQGFYDVDGFARRAVEVLRDPGAFHHLGREATARVRREYDIQVTLPRLARLFERAVEAC